MQPQRKTERLEQRCTAEEKRLIQQAAALLGASLTDFTRNSVLTAAKQIISEHNRIVLSLKDTEAFVNAIFNPLKPNKKLLNAKKRYLKEVHRQ